MLYSLIKKSNCEKINNYDGVLREGYADFYPSIIQIEHTNRCNARCIMCNHFYTSNRKASEISFDVIRKIEPILPYCRLIMLNGDGEPFLYSDIGKCINLYQKYGVKIGTNTNLSYLPDDILDQINGFEYLNISCDGASKETFELIRRGLDFDVFLENLKKINVKAPKVNRILDCVMMAQNITELSDIVELAGEYGCRKVKFNRMGINPCIGNYNDAIEQYMETARENLAAAIETAERIGVLIEYPKDLLESQSKDCGEIPVYEMMRQEIEERFRTVCEAMKDTGLDTDYLSGEVSMTDFNHMWNSGEKCDWAIERCYIDLKGNVTMCCYNTRKRMGSLKECSFEEIWNGELYREFRRQMYNGKLPIWCRECNWLKN